MLTELTARRLLTDAGEVDFPVITMEDGEIVRIESGEPNQTRGFTETLAATFFDIHVHGACSHDFMGADAAQIAEVSRFLAGRGVGHYLPTTVTGTLDATLRALETIADAIEAADDSGAAEAGAVPVGIHLEGPFVSHGKRGVHPEASIREPNVPLFDRFQQAARGHIRLMTLAPELPQALELIRHAARSGVRVSIGHSNATGDEILEAIAAGATSATHLGNAMRGLTPREPGVVGTILDRDELYAEAICDGVHVHPAFLRLWLKMKGPDKAILVTDGMSATGMPDGTYMLGDFSVEVKDGVCLAGGTLAGSVLTMDRAVANLQRYTGASLATAVRLASRNPARMLGMERLAEWTPGMAANFNVFNDAGERVGSVWQGRRA
jgi:N-acetylglucosamine-6-phosphate deacetylase